ncbi:unnamed protein product (macronuclear) [Paramecium tetraurelia]|uniref:Uncharacterized protein n=1 Tax=Paramecium tetraurelia TaxID=5888 RepID=A0BRP2_PARTE|nr:uncharacterized protein GSPATT00031440001 [Paramecium tetraurelia]CAK61209.1 unnamed protein product [Paramecium tetraurelia]|eukprot:XP_001428607.1 hypothetical protein (macronuclear) [Paramecium tetraurelia strain d4-2]
MQQLGAAHQNVPPETTIPDTAELRYNQVLQPQLKCSNMLKQASSSKSLVSYCEIQQMIITSESMICVSVESVNPIFQQKMVQHLNLTGRMKIAQDGIIPINHMDDGYKVVMPIILQSTSIHINHMNIVIDPIQTDSLINYDHAIGTTQTTSNTAIFKNLDQQHYYYLIDIKFNCNDLEQKIIPELIQEQGLKCNSAIENSNRNEQCVEEMSKLGCEYYKLIGIQFSQHLELRMNRKRESRQPNKEYRKEGSQKTSGIEWLTNCQMKIFMPFWEE